MERSGIVGKANKCTGAEIDELRRDVVQKKNISHQ